jgi:hypothetical protein
MLTFIDASLSGRRHASIPSMLSCVGPDSIPPAGRRRERLAAGVARLFAQLDDHHHGADHLAVWLPAPLGEQEAMVLADPERFFRPPYVGPRRWVGLSSPVRRSDSRGSP